jgi:hypothetical protein
MQRCTSRPWIATGLILLACLARPSLAQENPNGLVADVRNPYTGTAETLSDWCVPNHWTPWNGDWACDVWKDNGAYGVGQHPNPSCGRDVYLKVSPSMLPGWVVPDRLRAKVINVSHHGYACGNQNYSYGGYQQAFEIYATYDGVEIALG